MGWFKAAFNKEPAMMISAVIGGVAIFAPYVVVPIRRNLGLPTYQWDADPTTHPVCRLAGGTMPSRAALLRAAERGVTTRT